MSRDTEGGTDLVTTDGGVRYFVEYQIVQMVEGFDLTITITTDGGSWTSLPGPLDAVNWSEAYAAAQDQITALKKAMGAKT